MGKFKFNKKLSQIKFFIYRFFRDLSEEKYEKMYEI